MSEKAAKERSVAVVIVNYGTAQLVLNQMPALLSELAPMGAARVFIVDNCSPANDRQILSEAIAREGWSERVELLEAKRNGGFAYGNNVGFDAVSRWDVRPDAVLLLNPDAELRPGALEALFGALDREPMAGFVGPQLENEDGSTWEPGFRFPSIGNTVAGASHLKLLQRTFPLSAEVNGLTRVGWCGGAVILVRTEALQAVGPMDEGFFLYFEEVDWLRHAEALGWQTWVEPKAQAFHLEGGATGFKNEPRRPVYWYASWFRYYAKAKGITYARLTALGVITGNIFHILKNIVRGRASGLPQHALGDMWQHCVMGPVPKDLNEDKA